MELNYSAIVVAAVVQFIIGGIWYTPLFGRKWRQIHGFDARSPEEQRQMQKGMAPLLATQFLMSLLTCAVLALFHVSLPAPWHAFGMAGFFWLGFIMPTQVSAVIFGGTPPQWVMTKILISTGGSLACMMGAAAVFHLMR
jgi:hypothetical protein